MDFTTFTFLPHAQEQMALRGVSAEEAVETIRSPDRSEPGRLGRIVAEKDFGASVLRVVYNEGQDEAVVITVVPIRKRGGGR